MANKPPVYVSMPADVAALQTMWPIKVTRSTTKDEFIATIKTPQKTFEQRHVNQGLATQKCEEQVRAAELRGEVAPDFI